MFLMKRFIAVLGISSLADPMPHIINIDLIAPWATAVLSGLRQVWVSFCHGRDQVSGSSSADAVGVKCDTLKWMLQTVSQPSLLSEITGRRRFRICRAG